MKILIVNNSATNNINGRLCVHKATGELGLGLKELGHTIEYYQFISNSSSTISDFDLIENGIKVTGSNIYSSKFLSYFLGFCKGISRIVKNDFIYVFYPNSLGLLALLSRLFSKKYGLNVRGQVGINSWFSHILYRFAFTIQTEQGLDTIIRDENGSYRDKISCNKPTFYFGKQDVLWKRSYCKADNFEVLFVGRITREKGLFELLEAVKKLKAETQLKFRLNIIGNGEDLNELKQKVVDLSIVDSVAFLGFVSEEIKKEYYIKSDIYVIPTHHEGLPRTLYEAMIFRIPIITTFVGGIPSIMKDKFNCYEIEKESVESITNTLKYVMNNYSEVEEITQNGLNTVLKIVDPNRPSHAMQLGKILNDLHI